MRIDLQPGEVFAKWTVLRLDPESTTSRKYLCKCECGRVQSVFRPNLTRSLSKSCVECATFTHGMTGSREYRSWHSAKDRCFNQKSTSYGRYGGRGITMSEEWRDSFEAFYRDMGPRPPGTTLERIKNGGDYEPGNCEWATAKEQTRNRSTCRFYEHEGERLTVADWAERIGMQYDTFYNRVRALGSVQKVIDKWIHNTAA